MYFDAYEPLNEETTALKEQWDSFIATQIKHPFFAELTNKLETTLKDLKVGRFYRKEIDDKKTSLIICNYYKIEKGHKSNSVFRFYKWNIKSKQWQEIRNLNGIIFNEYPFRLYPVRKLDLDSAVNLVLKSVLEDIAVQLGFYSLNTRKFEALLYKTSIPKAIRDDFRSFGTYENIEIQNKCFLIIKKRYLNSNKSYQTNLCNGLKGLIKDLWALLDKNIYSYLIKVHGIFGGDRYISHYNEIIRRLKELKRIEKEHPNFLPITPYLKRPLLKDKNIFSEKYWISEGNSSVIDHQTNLNTFSSNKGYRWLKKARVSVVQYYVNNLNMPSLLEILASSNIPTDIPTIVIRRFLRKVNSRGNQLVNTFPTQKVVREYFLYCQQIWKQQGYKALTSQLYRISEKLNDIFDYLYNGYGIQNINKNATWNSLENASNRWHREIQHANTVRWLEQNNIPTSWESKLPETTIKGYNVIPLTSTDDLLKEGIEMHHCVGGYSSYCAEGHFRIFSIKNETERATLCIQRQGLKWVVQQIRGFCNDPVSNILQKIAISVAKLYTKSTSEKEV